MLQRWNSTRSIRQELPACGTWCHYPPRRASFRRAARVPRHKCMHYHQTDETDRFGRAFCSTAQCNSLRIYALAGQASACKECENLASRIYVLANDALFCQRAAYSTCRSRSFVKSYDSSILSATSGCKARSTLTQPEDCCCSGRFQRWRCSRYFPNAHGSLSRQPSRRCTLA